MSETNLMLSQWYVCISNFLHRYNPIWMPKPLQMIMSNKIASHQHSLKFGRRWAKNIYNKWQSSSRNYLKRTGFASFSSPSFQSKLMGYSAHYLCNLPSNTGWPTKDRMSHQQRLSSPTNEMRQNKQIHTFIQFWPS